MRARARGEGATRVRSRKRRAERDGRLWKSIASACGGGGIEK